MNIIIVSDDFPEKGHQSYVFVEQLVIALCDLGVNVKVIAPQSLTKSILRGRERNPKRKTVQTKKGGTYEVYRPYYLSAGSKGLLGKIYFHNLRRAVEGVINKIGIDNIDVLYGHFWHNANTLVNVARKYKKPLFVACGEGDNAIDELLEAISASAKERLINAVNGVISVSSENKKRVIDYQLALPENIAVIPNAVDKSVFYQKDRLSLRQKLGISISDFVVCFVGGFIDRKGSNRLSDAITQLNDPTIKSIFIGKPWSYDDCTPNCPGILVKESLPHEMLPDYLNASDVFVLPTLNEGCCNAIVEALSCGIPVISSNLPFNDDLLDQTNSIRIDPMNVEEIKDAILCLKNDKELRDSLSKGSVTKSESFSIEERAKKILEFINSKS
jgi:glycosyltransferase involved in cell wall biosynthesis